MAMNYPLSELLPHRNIIPRVYQPYLMGRIEGRAISHARASILAPVTAASSNSTTRENGALPTRNAILLSIFSRSTSRSSQRHQGNLRQHASPRQGHRFTRGCIVTTVLDTRQVRGGCLQAHPTLTAGRSGTAHTRGSYHFTDQ